MKGQSKILYWTVILIFFISSGLKVSGQTWNFIKEKNGIKIYTCTPENSNFKSFKGETVFHATMEQLGQYIGNVKNFNWWDKNVRELKILESQPGKHARYYLVYHVPWPLSDRDLCVEVFINYDTVKKVKTVSARPLTGVIPERKGLVRIKAYRQSWTLTAINDSTVKAVLEGYVDPGGSIPAWIYNMVIVDTPVNVMSGIKARVEPASAVKQK